jgi:hypothetical protein
MFKVKISEFTAVPVVVMGPLKKALAFAGIHGDAKVD